jgi:hypothetical protein
MFRWLLLVALVGCGSPPAQPVSPRVVKRLPPPPPPPPPPKSPFHVIGWTEHVSEKTGNPTTLCEIDGGVFVCGTEHVVRLEGDDLVKDTALEAGLMRDDSGALNGRIQAMLGRFPDDAWLVMRTGVNIGTVAIYRRTKDWSLTKKWKVEGLAGNVDVIAWKKGTLAALVNPDGEHASVEQITKSGASPLAPLPKATACPQWIKWPKLGVAKDGALAVSGNRCDGDTPAWVRLAPGKLAEKRDGEPEYAPTTPSDYVIVSSELQKGGEDVPLPPPPVAGASTLVPFQVLVRDKDVIVAASFRKEKMQGVAILRTTPAKNPSKL